MPEFSGQFEYLGPGAASPLQAGSVGLSFDAEILTLAGQGPAIAFDLGDIDVFEAGEYELRLALFDGHTVRLTRFGKSFQDLARQLLDAYRDRLVKCLLVSDLDEVARYSGRVRLESGARACDGPAEIRLYRSNLAVLPDAAIGFQWRLAEIDEVEFDEREYVVVVRRGAERLVIGKLAKRTGELAERLRQAIAAMEERSARVLHAVFPFLSSAQFREVSSRMRDGASTPVADLRPIHRLIETSLLERVVDGALRPYLRELVARASPDGWQAGFKVIRKDTDGAGQDDLEAESGGEADGFGDEAEQGLPPDPAVADAGDGLEVLYWFFVPVAPAGQPAARVAWEATSRGGRATYVFRLAGTAGADDVRQAIQGINAGLVALNFRREPVYLGSDTLESEARYRHYAIAARKVRELAVVREAFVGRAIHRSLGAWRRQLDSLLAG